MESSAGRKYKEYGPEAAQRWGGTAAYAEYSDKTKDYSDEKFDGISAGLDGIFARFAAYMQNGSAPSDAQAQALVSELRQYISDNLYTCTDAILAGLGQIYVSDGRFTQNIDRHGEGAAEFVNRAIEYNIG